MLSITEDIDDGDVDRDDAHQGDVLPRLQEVQEFFGLGDTFPCEVGKSASHVTVPSDQVLPQDSVISSPPRSRSRRTKSLSVPSMALVVKATAATMSTAIRCSTACAIQSTVSHA